VVLPLGPLSIGDGFHTDRGVYGRQVANIRRLVADFNHLPVKKQPFYL